MLLGESGKVTVFDITDPSKPSTMWGGGKTLNLGVKMGTFIKYPGAAVLYMTLPNTAIVRIDLSSFSNPNFDQIKPSDAVTKIAGSGGGGIAMIYDDKGSPVRLYVAQSGSNKVNVWIVSDIEGGKKSPKPSSSFNVSSLKKITGLYSYKVNDDDIRGWLIATSEPTEEIDYEILDLGRHWKNAAEPQSVGTANVGNIMSFSGLEKIFVTTELNIWDFSQDETKPVQVAESTLREEAVIRAMVVNGKYIYTAEKGGLRVYLYDKGKLATK